MDPSPRESSSLRSGQEHVAFDTLNSSTCSGSIRTIFKLPKPLLSSLYTFNIFLNCPHQHPNAPKALSDTLPSSSSEDKWTNPHKQRCWGDLDIMFPWMSSIYSGKGPFPGSPVSDRKEDSDFSSWTDGHIGALCLFKLSVWITSGISAPFPPSVKGSLFTFSFRFSLLLFQNSVKKVSFGRQVPV